MTNYPNITINLYDPYPIRVLNIKQYDTGRGAMVTLTGLGGEVITPTGNGLYVLAKKRDGNIVYNTVTLVGNQIKIDFDEQMTVLSGLLQVEIQMIDAQGETISTPIFAVNVMPSNINPLQIESTSEFGALTDALADVENLKQNGLKGDPGDAATIQVGTVTATDPGGNPAVTNSGTEQDAVLDFTLPRGEPGSIWYQGSAITGTNTSGTVFTGSGIANAELNDMYLNVGSGTDKGNVYVCVLAGDANTAKWAYKQNIMGPTGPAGTANASSVAYNNESSGLTAGNVQGALDELTNKTKIVLRQSTDNYSENIGRYISFEDMVIITAIYKVTNECPPYSTSIGIPRPYVSDGIAVKDSTGNYAFQINQNGVFQNVSVLPPGTYSVYAVYIARNL